MPLRLPASSVPAVMLLFSVGMSSTVSRSASFPLAARSLRMPGCGNIAMSGRLLPWTRVLMRALKSLEGDHLIVMPWDFA